MIHWDRFTSYPSTQPSTPTSISKQIRIRSSWDNLNNRWSNYNLRPLRINKVSSAWTHTTSIAPWTSCSSSRHSTARRTTSPPPNPTTTTINSNTTPSTTSSWQWNSRPLYRRYPPTSQSPNWENPPHPQASSIGSSSSRQNVSVRSSAKSNSSRPRRAIWLRIDHW